MEFSTILRFVLLTIVVLMATAEYDESAYVNPELAAAAEMDYFTNYIKKGGPQGPLRFGKRRGPSGPLRFGKRSGAPVVEDWAAMYN